MKNKVVKLVKENKMIFRKIFCAIVVLAFSGSSFLYAGDASRIGTTAGVQVLIPVGGRNLAMAGADVVNTSSLDAIFWNPAGLANMSSKAAGLFSTMNILADINVSYFAVGMKAGGFGDIAVSVKSFGFGDIPLTTVYDPDGQAGKMFSPTFSTIGLTYSRVLTDRINVGITGKMIYESIPRASASAFAFDLGIQYKDLMRISGLGLGLVIKNIGTNMEYGGAAFLTESRDVGGAYDNFREIPTTSDQLPASVEIGLSYLLSVGDNQVMLSSTFLHNNFEHDNLKIGAELKLFNMVFVRGGFTTLIKDPDNPDYGEVVYGLTLGSGCTYKLMGTDVFFDYAYRPSKYFSGNASIISMGFGI